jgi:fatty-acyl-CoA synthase
MKMLCKFLNIQAKIVDKDGRMVPMGSKGELWVRGYSVMQGYWGDEERTRELIRPDGWTKTG